MPTPDKSRAVAHYQAMAAQAAQLAKHTPGPWYSRPAASGARDFGICASAPSARLGVVVVAEVFAELKHEGECSEQTPHNACLIAAAPDLLEVLVGLAEAAQRLGWDMKKARAAIAKATGAPA